MKLRNQQSVIISDYENTPKKEILPVIGKISYYLILIVILAFIGRFVFNSVLYSTGSGKVVCESFLISSGDYSQIKQIFKEKGDKVKKGSPLVSLIKFSNDYNFYESELIKLQSKAQEEKRKLIELKKDNLSLKSTLNPFTMKKIEINKDINNLEAEIEELKKNAVSKEKAVQTFRALRILEAVESDSINSDEAEKQANRILYMKDKLSNLRSLYRKISRQEKEYIDELRHEKKIKTDSLESSILNIHKNIDRLNTLKSESYKYTTLFSPAEGTVKNVFRLKGENVEKNDSIIEIVEKNPDILIRSFFPVKLIDKLSVNKELTVVFPDGKKTKGIIESIYSLSDRKTVEILDGYEPLETHIAADIQPVSSEDKSLWKKYDKLDVEVRFIK